MPVVFTYGANFIPIGQRLQLPTDKEDTTIFLLSNSFEYDIEMIKNFPSPKGQFKSYLIPYRLYDKIGERIIRYNMSQQEYVRCQSYVNSQKLVPAMTHIRFPYPKTIKNNLYIPISNYVKLMDQVLSGLPPQYTRKNIYTMFEYFFKQFNFSKKKIIWIDTTRFHLSKNLGTDSLKSNLIDALLASYVLNSPEEIRSLQGWILVFHSPDADYRFDLGYYEKRDEVRLKSMMQRIGYTEIPESSEDISSSDSFDTDDEGNEDLSDPSVSDEENEEQIDSDEEDNEEIDSPTEVEDEEEVRSQPLRAKNVTQSLLHSIQMLKSSRTNPGLTSSVVSPTDETEEEKNERDSLYNSKTADINSKLMNRITTSTEIIDNYKTISRDIKSSSPNKTVEDRILDDAAKRASGDREPVNTEDVMNTVTSAREQKIREKVGQVKLNNITFNTINSITDVPLPKPQRPNNITTTNTAAKRGSSFANMQKEYEEKLLERDIVAVLMNLSKIPDGFYVTDVQVTDISTVTTMMNNWRITLRNKKSDKQSVINVRIPKVKNSRFFYNGIWYNIGKQDFPIPILKIDKKTVIMTSNYHKITVSRHDTKSLVDIAAFVKVVKTLTDGENNPYVKTGSSLATNSKFISTVDYDEYAKIWYYFRNKEADCEIIFNRQDCLKKFGFVTVQENEFCCGMINQVPVVINTDTGLTRNGETLTETMLHTLPSHLQNAYLSNKPGKMTMYAEIKIEVVFPLGVAIAAWEGITSLLKRSGAQYQFVDNRFKDSKYIVIRFKNKCLAIQNTIVNQLIFNGFFRINTKAFDFEQFEDPIMNPNSIYVDIFNQHFFKTYSQLTTFIANYNFFVDAITEDVCAHYNIPTDIVGMLIYSANLLADNSFMKESNASLYRIRSSEVIPAILHYTLARAISKYNNRLGSKARDNNLQYNPNELIAELLEINTVNPMSALNPMIELHTREEVSKQGFSGVNNDRAYSRERRSYDQSMVGKTALSSPNSGNVGIKRQLTADPKIESVRGYTSTKTIDDEYNDFGLASFSELLTSGTVSRDDAIRTAIATSQTGHMVSTEGSQPTLVSNGADECVPAYLTDEFSVMAEEDGKVLEIADGYMIIEYIKKGKKAISLSDKYSFNPGSGFYVNNKLTPNCEAGSSFKQGDILAYHGKFFSKDNDGVVRLNIGPLAKVAFMGLYSTYEDAGIMTSKMSKRLSTTLTMMQLTKINAMDDIESIVKVGTEVEIGDPLIVFGMGDTGDKAVDNFLKAFGDGMNPLDKAKRVVKSKHPGKVVDVRLYTTKPNEKLSPSLADIFNAYYRENIKKRAILDKYDKHDTVYKLDTLYTLPTKPLTGTSIKGITADVIVEVYIEHDDDVSVGDKAVVYGASKQIISEVVPEGLEPYSEFRPDEEISMLVAPSSVLKRMIPSITILAGANKVLVEAKRKMREIWEQQ